MRLPDAIRGITGRDRLPGANRSARSSARSRVRAESKEARPCGRASRCLDPGGDLLSRGNTHSTIGAVGLTAVFGMGTGVSRTL